MTIWPIEITTIPVKIAEQISSAIMTGEYTSGYRLPAEKELAKMFCVSQPSVKEALKKLSTAGLITTHPCGWTVVLSPKS